MKSIHIPYIHTSEAANFHQTVINHEDSEITDVIQIISILADSRYEN